MSAELILLLIGAWGVVCAMGWRLALPKFVFRFSNTLLAVAVTYVAMVAFFFASLWFLDISGWRLKGSNDALIQQIGMYTFFLSPFGLPLLFGGPIVLVVDLFLLIKRKFWGDIK